MVAFSDDEHLDAMFEQVSNWGRWGADDERGALNLIGPEEIVRAARLIVNGRRVSCALDLPVERGREYPIPPVQHMMIRAGDAPEIAVYPGMQVSEDYVGVACHGPSVTHLDALCHVFVKGRMYNGRPGTDVKSTGAVSNALDPAFDGVTGRGVLLDIPRLRGRQWIEPGDPVTTDHLDAAVAEQGVEVGTGDILLISTGREARRATGPDHRLAGLHPSCAEWIHARDVAVLGSDGISDPLPPAPGDWPLPIHQLCLAAMGVPLLDNLRLADLAAACAEQERWTFFFTAAPLRIPSATGSALNPIAVF
jgi:kynurenine formamidase